MDGMVLVYVPGGEFVMGAASADPDALEREKPAHSVVLDGYWIDSTEVTNAMYAGCVADGGCSPQTEDTSFSRSAYANESTCAGYPVVHVTWQQADDYCLWAGRRLPTEAEWEKAARGTDGRLFAWGDQAPSDAMANLCGSECRMEPRDRAIDDGFLDTAPVGHFAQDVSPFGAFDLTGNVAEWVADRGQEGYYAVSPAENPTGPAAGDTRVFRGAAFNVIGSGARLTFRSFLLPSASSDSLGFRCAIAVEP
jgi:formylglycine-generating enzyme required for sulfatase activity